LVPWDHYVPVKKDLSDLVQNVQYVLDPENDAAVRKIVASANLWCSQKLIRKQLAHDMLDIWDSYIQMLNRADPNWAQAWAEKKALLMSSSDVELVQVAGTNSTKLSYFDHIANQMTQM